MSAGSCLLQSLKANEGQALGGLVGVGLVHESGTGAHSAVCKFFEGAPEDSLADVAGTVQPDIVSQPLPAGGRLSACQQQGRACAKLALQAKHLQGRLHVCQRMHAAWVGSGQCQHFHMCMKRQ